MSGERTMRVCVDQSAINALQREGIGWGYDLDCGCFHVERPRRASGPIARFRAWMKKGAV